MKQNSSERFAVLKAKCSQYDKIDLHNLEGRGGYIDKKRNQYNPKIASIHVEPASYSQNGFISKFCR